MIVHMDAVQRYVHIRDFRTLRMELLLEILQSRAGKTGWRPAPRTTRAQARGSLGIGCAPPPSPAHARRMSDTSWRWSHIMAMWAESMATFSHLGDVGAHEHQAACAGVLFHGAAERVLRLAAKRVHLVQYQHLIGRLLLLLLPCPCPAPPHETRSVVSAAGSSLTVREIRFIATAGVRKSVRFDK